MADSSPIVLILGAGPNIGKHVAQSFAAKGYKVALASRTDHRHSTSDDTIHIPTDLSEPNLIIDVFAQVEEKLGAAPSVVVYNGALRIPDDTSDPIGTFSFANHHSALAVNHLSVLQALHQAVLGFRTLPASASKTFIFTGNILNMTTRPGVLSFGITKTATSYAFRYLGEQRIYEKEGIKFYYADERSPTGDAVYLDIDGAAAAEEYVKLSERKDQGPWLHTFTKGHGYKDFGSDIKPSARNT
ncbi:hypothetical protein PV11_04753 [Exophiala sideris]|uniref:Short-chain dehydrogenase n=1 Tax=Exophiala sideris TaxID=1016849 RepID=A0A0D1YNC7_9EURO|nr:hypothetical protein PV11_04753 [Exophiala sideris]